MNWLDFLLQEAMQKHQEVLSREKLDLDKVNVKKKSRKRKDIEGRRDEYNLETDDQWRVSSLQHELKRLHKEEEDSKLKYIEEQEARCKKMMVAYVHGDSLSRLLIEPSLHRMLQPSFSDESKRSEFIKSLTAAAIKPVVEYAGVYVLKLGGLPYTHYIGCSKTVLARIEQHRSGNGAACTTGATSIEVLPLLTEGSEADLDAWERVETLTLMYTIGIDKVRGWHYVQRKISDEDRRHIHRNICSRNGLCHRCGFGSHMMTQCFARHCSLWMGGGRIA